MASKERNPGVCGPCLAGSHLQCAGTPIVDQETGDLSCDDCACPKCRNMDKLQNKPDGKLNQQTKDENKVNRTMLRHTDLTDDVIRFVENSNPTQIAFRLQELMKSERSAKRNLRAIGIISTNEDLVMHGEKSAIEWMLGRPIQDPENSETESKPL